MNTEDYIKEILDNYTFEGKYTGYRQICDGHINRTFALQFSNNTGSSKEYLVQMINTNVFKNPDELMENIVGVTKYMRDIIIKNGGNPARETLNVIISNNNKPYIKAADGTCWRCYDYITDAYSCQMIDNPQVFYNTGKSFGDFMSMLADYPSETLHETIPDFHNTKARFSNLLKAIERDTAGRAESVQDEISFALARSADSGVLVDLIKKGELPIRVTHNDTKLNNIMFDNQTNLGICVLDLDTVMPGLSLYDFGDAIRSGACTAAEDEKDVSKVKLDIELFAQYTNGYLSSAGKSLTETEVKYLPFSAKLLTFECGMRFLTDYLDGDTYFQTNYPEHNLVRCRTQFALVSDMESKMSQMEEITQKYYRRVVH